MNRPRGQPTHIEWVLAALVVVLAAAAVWAPRHDWRGTVTDAKDRVQSWADGHNAPTGAGNLTGYSRAKFHFDQPRDADGCRVRDRILTTALVHVVVVKRRAATGRRQCTVISGVLHDPYTGRTVPYTVKHATAVQIDHIVPLAEAWRSGANAWTTARRTQFANDPANLVAVYGPENERKGDDDPAHYLPPRAAYRCTYLTRYTAVKTKYGLTTDDTEATAIQRASDACPAAAHR